MTIAVGLVLAVPAAAAAQLPQVVDIRFGRHTAFDRLVIQLDGAAEIRLGQDAGQFVLELAASPPTPSRTIDTALSRTGLVEIRATDSGLELRIEARPRRSRVFALDDPPRVVIDFADPSPAPFVAPAGTRAILAGTAEERTLEPDPALAEAEPAPPVPAEPPEPELAPEARTEPEPAEPAPLPVEEPAMEPELEAAAEPEPLPAEELVPEPVPEVAELPAPDAVSPIEETAIAPPAWRDYRLMALGAAAIAALAALVLIRLRLRSRAAEPDAGEVSDDEPSFPAQTIAPSEIEALSRDRMTLLVKRMDDEARARTQLEEQVGELREELKVMSDKTRRLQQRERGGE
jgi:hypothetical protein